VSACSTLFVDEDMEFARRLVDSGVVTELLIVPGTFHGFDVLARNTQVASALPTPKSTH
jgi:acetyl esterase/lipase